LGVLDSVWHPTEPWIISVGADGVARLWCSWYLGFFFSFVILSNLASLSLISYASVTSSFFLLIITVKTSVILMSLFYFFPSCSQEPEDAVDLVDPTREIRSAYTHYIKDFQSS
jgi:hypothetical protein